MTTLNATNYQKLDLGNNESAVSGVFKEVDGTYRAVPFFTAGRTFKTLKGAERWLAKRLAD